MNFKIVLLFFGLLLVAIVFSAINFNLAEKKNKTAAKAFISGVSKVLSDIAIGLIIAFIPTVILLNHLKPQPENVMPVFIYDGTYVEITDDMVTSMADSLIADCNIALEQSSDTTKYFDRAFLYFKTGNFDLAYVDLQKCIELEENWMFYYDIGVVCGYLLDYSASIDFFDAALDMNIPISERGLVVNTLTMIESYFDSWIYSLVK